ncbi:calcitonin receptor-like isoform X2 [Haliotis rubra]|nr:calcitonin receptor-like isoform X2 [Haliotis rubra]XP_046564331.1 calcitonin receptor-like isoform X2 [Haliotis rubra]
MNITGTSHELTTQGPSKALFKIDYDAWRQCNETVLQRPYPDDGRLYCNSTFDGWLCFDYTPAGETVYKPCPVKIQPGFNPEAFGRKYCMEDGRWYVHPDTGATWTDYRACPLGQNELSVIMLYISGYAASLILCLISIVVFNLFRQLKCNRVTLHQHLFVSYILTGLLWILYYTEVAMKHDVIRENPVWCRVLHVLTQYITTCNYVWMLCEGFYLHTLIALAFTKEKKLLWICIIFGWVFPVFPTLLYACLRGTSDTDNAKCWLYESSMMWVVIGPVVLSIVVNLSFLVNILRILCSKLRAFNSSENHQNRRAVRAILILIPLLGLQYLVIPFRPSSGPSPLYIFNMISAFLVSFQGVFVALIFCFFNGEVMTVLRRKWNQVRHNYDPGYSERRRSLTNTTAVPWEESTVAMPPLIKNGSGRSSSRHFATKSQEVAEMQCMMNPSSDNN